MGAACEKHSLLNSRTQSFPSQVMQDKILAKQVAQKSRFCRQSKKEKQSKKFNHWSNSNLNMKGKTLFLFVSN